MIQSLIFLSLLAATTSAPSAEAQQAASVRVSYADLDLSSASGRKTLDRRLAEALNTVCPTARPGYITPSAKGLRCRAATARKIAALREQALARHGGAPIQVSVAP